MLQGAFTLTDAQFVSSQWAELWLQAERIHKYTHIHSLVASSVRYTVTSQLTAIPHTTLLNSIWGTYNPNIYLFVADHSIYLTDKMLRLLQQDYIL
jgi:hypothetical protein